MPRDPSSKRPASLLSRLVDGLLDETSQAELEAMLRRSRAAPDYYRRYLATHQDLAEYGKSDMAVIDLATIPRPRRMEWLAAAASPSA